MRKGVASVILVIPLLAAVMLFNACPIPFAKAHEVPPFQRPEWAVNKYGNIDLYVSDLDTIIDYNPNEGYSAIHTLSYTSTVYTGGGKYTVSYEITSSILGVIDRGSTQIEEASYESTTGALHASEGDIKNFNFVIPKSLEGLQNVTLVISYNISGLRTKIVIPIDVKRPASGTVLTTEAPIFYSASPVIPSSDKARLEVSSRKIIVMFNLSDFGGCFSKYKKYRRFPSVIVSYDASLKYADREVKNILSCDPKSLKIFPVQIICSINVDGDESIKKAFNSEAGVHLELIIDVGPYDCMMSRSYTIQVRKYT